MSRQDKQRWLRQLICEGCDLHCRYADFRAFGPYAGGFAPSFKRDYKEEVRRRRARREARARGEELPHGNTGKRHLGQQEFGGTARDAVATNDTQVKVRKGLVLGRMFKTKMELWELYTATCPGREAPETPPSCLSEYQENGEAVNGNDNESDRQVVSESDEGARTDPALRARGADTPQEA